MHTVQNLDGTKTSTIYLLRALLAIIILNILNLIMNAYIWSFNKNQASFCYKKIIKNCAF